MRASGRIWPRTHIEVPAGGASIVGGPGTGAPHAVLHRDPSARCPLACPGGHAGAMEGRKQFFEHLRRQGGVGHINEGRVFGLSPDSVRKYWRRNDWPMPFPGVVVLPGTEMDLRRRSLAATTWVGPPVAVTGVSALRLLGATDRDPVKLDLVVPTIRRNRKGSWGTVHRSDVAFERPLLDVAGVPTVPVPWAIRDRMVFGGPGHPRTHVIRAMQRRLATLEQLEAAACETPHAPGVPSLLEILRVIRRDRVDSGLELDTRVPVRAAGYHPWPRPFPTQVPNSWVIHLDIALPDKWIDIECEDPHTHGPEAFTRDRTRWNQTQRAGWHPIFVWRDRLENDLQGFLEELADAVAKADPGRPPAVPAHDCDALGC